MIWLESCRIGVDEVALLSSKADFSVESVLN